MSQSGDADVATTSTPNLQSLDALRGALALYVMLGHVRWLLWDGHWRWVQEPHEWWENVLAYGSAMFRYGHEAVICFFVLSGFFIHFRWASARSVGRVEPLVVRDYVRRRGHRLFPPYGLALVATVAIDAVGWTLFPSLYAGATGVTLLDQNFARMGYSSQSVVPALMLLPSSLGFHFGTNGPLWSLAYEFVYYALYPVWLWARVQIGMAAYVAASAVAVGLSILVPSSFASELLNLYPLWLLGAAMAELALFRGVPPRTYLFVLAAALGFAGFHAVKGPYLIVPYLLFGFGVVALASSIPHSALRSPVHRVFHWLGVRSYTLYVCHFPAVALISAAVFENYGRRPLNGWLALAGVIAVLAWCNALWWLCERRFLHARLTPIGRRGAS